MGGLGFSAFRLPAWAGLTGEFKGPQRVNADLPEAETLRRQRYAINNPLPPAVIDFRRAKPPKMPHANRWTHKVSGLGPSPSLTLGSP